MSRIYAVREDDSKRILVEIVCDGCGMKIVPHPKIGDSGWMKAGFTLPTGDIVVHEYCPNCYRPLGSE